MISVAGLVAAGIAPTQAREFCEPLSIACERFGIDTPPRIAGFVAQCRVESAGFTRLEESLFYRKAERIKAIWPSRFASFDEAARYVGQPERLANRVYAGRLGNGDESSGDGWRYRGRGLKQLTGRDNYRAAGAALRRPYEEFPELVALPPDACLSAAWFWHSRNLNALADGAQWDEITRAVNGPGMLQASERRQYSAEGVQAFA